MYDHVAYWSTMVNAAATRSMTRKMTTPRIRLKVKRPTLWIMAEVTTNAKTGIITNASDARKSSQTATEIAAWSRAVSMTMTQFRLNTR